MQQYRYIHSYIDSFMYVYAMVFEVVALSTFKATEFFEASLKRKNRRYIAWYLMIIQSR